MPQRLRKKIMPQSLRGRIMLLVCVMICLPVITIAYIVETQGREALLGEKETKLHGAARLLDVYLGDRFQLDMQGASREDQIATLNQRTTRLAENITQAYPGMGAGYYHRGLDAIITYAPNHEYGYTVGQPIASDHPGRIVMAENRSMTAFGSLVRGNIMNAMRPIERDGEVLGYIWANELVDDVQLQMRRLDIGVILVMVLGLAFSIIAAILLSRSLGRDVDKVVSGLRRLRYDLTAQLPPLKGEIGEIAKSANAMANAVREARGLTDNILVSISDGVITVDNDGIVTMLNPAAQRICELIPENVLNRPYREAIAGIPFDSSLLYTLETGNHRAGFELEYPVRGGVRYLSTSSSVIRNANGDSLGAVAFIRDMTERKQMQHHMERAEQLAALGELIAGVAHEIRNPLTAIRGFVQYLQEGATPEERNEYTGIILKEVDSINRVIHQLLSFAKPAPQHYQMVAVSSMVQDALILVRTKGTAGRIDFLLHIPASLPDIEVDGELVKQALVNLMLNAVQAIPAKGTIEITARHLISGEVEIKIADSGVGIDEEDQERIFTPFFTTKPSGTGLGLSIVQRIVNAHHGDITIRSAKGRGTAITLTFPIRRETMTG